MKHELPPLTGEDKVYYLASPYSSPDEYTKEKRYITVCAIAAALTNLGYILVEPIGASHPLARMFKLPTGYTHWKRRDRALVARCDGVIVAQMAGWEDSVGITDEAAYARSIGKPVYWVDPKVLGVFEGVPSGPKTPAAVQLGLFERVPTDNETHSPWAMPQ